MRKEERRHERLPPAAAGKATWPPRGDGSACFPSLTLIAASCPPSPPLLVTAVCPARSPALPIVCSLVGAQTAGFGIFLA